MGWAEVREEEREGGDAHMLFRCGEQKGRQREMDGEKRPTNKGSSRRRSSQMKRERERTAPQAKKVSLY